MMGQSYCNNAKQKLRQLKELKKAFCILEREMVVNLSELEDAMKNVAIRCNECEVRDIFQKIADKIEDDAIFADAFTEILQESPMKLNDELINNMASAARGIGYMDLENNSNMIKLIIKELDDIIAQESSGLPDKLKVYRTVAVALGVGLAIIFI